MLIMIKHSKHSFNNWQHINLTNYTSKTFSISRIQHEMEGLRNCLLGIVMIMCMCQAETSELGRLKIKVNKLSRNHDALQSDVDKIWEIIIKSDMNTQENRTRAENVGTNTREFITNVNGTLAILQDQKRVIENMAASIRNGLKQEKTWQREAISNITKYCEDIESHATKEKQYLLQTIKNMQENNVQNEQTLSNVETENRELRNLIVELQIGYEKIQGNIEKREAENVALKRAIREIQNDNVNMKAVLDNLERKLSNITPKISTTTSTTTTTTPITTATARFDQCGEGWTMYNGHCYLSVKQRLSWEDAVSYCEARQGYLLEITTDAERTFISSELARQYGNYFQWVWVGATYRRSRSTYLYQHSGEPVPNNYWLPGQPNFSHGDQPHCALMGSSSTSSDVYLADLSCSLRASFICEK